ncbi:MAG: ATP-binding protein [Bacteroidota bacterium]
MLIQKIRPKYVWNDIVLPQNQIKELRKITKYIKLNNIAISDRGSDKNDFLHNGVYILFTGESGTGKTMAAEILSNDCNNHSSRKPNLYRIDMANVVSKYIGETEKNLKKVFNAAQRSGAILFFDEADALFGKRSEIKDSHDRYANIEVNYLLQCMEEYRGIAILATNNKKVLDHVFLKKIRFIVNFPFPDTTNRKLIWEKAFSKKVPVSKLEYNTLARLKIPGGNIKNIAVNAVSLAEEEKKPVDMLKVMHVAQREYEKMNKQITEGEFGKYYSLVK